MAKSPYDGLEPRAYWRSGVVDRKPTRLEGLYDPRFLIAPDTRVMTAGSCFAQHVHRAMTEAGYDVIDEEPAPAHVGAELADRYFYGKFSARYGNVYTSRQFLQLLREAEGTHIPAHPVWVKDGFYIDALRPSVEPKGHATPEAVLLARHEHLAAVRAAVRQADVLVFTLGLTETWADADSGTVYPSAPGVIGVAPEGARITFLNLSHDDVVRDLHDVLAHLRTINPALKLLLTVSPVPLTATATGGHILLASTLSKAILRAAVATIMAEDPGVDYFPSYEIITNPAARSRFFAENLRQPTPKGVETVMAQFLAAMGAAGKPSPKAAAGQSGPSDAAEAICEEALNDAQGAG